MHLSSPVGPRLAVPNDSRRWLENAVFPRNSWHSRRRSRSPCCLRRAPCVCDRKRKVCARNTCCVRERFRVDPSGPWVMCLGTAQSPSITCSLLPTPGTLHTKKKGVVALERGELETEMLSLALRVSVCEDVGAIAVDHAVLVADAGHPERNRHIHIYIYIYI